MDIMFEIHAQYLQENIANKMVKAQNQFIDYLT